MSLVLERLCCDACGAQAGDIGNWNRDGRWVDLARLFDGPLLVLPVPVQEVQLRDVNGRLLCQRCAAGEARR